MAVRALTIAAQVAATCPNGYRQHRDVCYKLFLTPQTFCNAAAVCQTDGGTLAMPREAAINRFLLRILSTHRADKVWFGLHDQRDEGEWTWVDGTPLGAGYYNRWGPGQPDNSHGRQDCAYHRRYRWYDGDCNAQHRFICQVLFSAPQSVLHRPHPHSHRCLPLPADTTANFSRNNCFSAPHYPDGTAVNFSRNNCFSAPHYPDGTAVNFSRNNCFSAPHYPDHTTVNFSRNNCFSAPHYPDGTAVNFSRNNCFSAPHYPDGTKVNFSRNNCFSAHHYTDGTAVNFPGKTVSQHHTTQTAQRSTLPRTTVSQDPNYQAIQRSTFPGTTVSQHPNYQTAHRTTLPGTTVSQSPTNQTTNHAGGSWNKTKPLDIALVCAGCAVGLVGMCGVLLYCVKRRQRRRQVAQDPRDLNE
ncbi:hypothetical protein Bbelb_160020 [Branchiostoma belcheri]|nr:hypothetical protein Bbelb_160020 [Branchiostoma belcheri]